MAYKANIRVTLRSSILDPQGKAIHRALEDLGFNHVDDVRMGKYIELWLDAPSETVAETMAREACEKLLANPVMENFDISLEALVAAA